MKKTFTLYITLSLLACGMLAAQLPVFPDIFVVTSDNILHRYNSEFVNTVVSTKAITGLKRGEVVLDIDIRPSNGALYALAFNRNTSAANLYTIYAPTGAATHVAVLDGCQLYTYPTDETPRYGIDFDPVHDKLRIVGQDTQNYRVNPSNGVCTQQTNLFFNGPFGAGSTPTRAVAFTNNILPTTTSSEYILTGVHLTIVNTADFAGNYIIRADVITSGPFDIHTQQLGTAQVNVPLLITPTYDSTVYAFNYSNIELRSISLENGLQELVGTFNTPATGVYFYGLATIPAGWTAPPPPRH